MTLADLATRWRQEAELLEAHGAHEAAATKARDAAELEAALTEWELEQLTPAQAAAETGFSESQIRRQFPKQPLIERRRLGKKAQRFEPPLTTERVRPVAKAGRRGHGARDRRSAIIPLPGGER